MTLTDKSTVVRQHVREFLQENMLFLHPDLDLADDDDLLGLGVLDSMGFVELVELVQQHYGIAVEDAEITEENFGSISAVAAFVGRRSA